MERIIKNYPLEIIMILLIGILSLLIILLIKRKNNKRDYKLYDFKSNTLIIGLYLVGFIMLILYVRYLRWGFELNLLLLYEKLSYYVRNTAVLYMIIILLIGLIMLISLYHIKKYFGRELIKRHLYYYHKIEYRTLVAYYNKYGLSCNTTPLISEYGFYFRLINYLSNQWSMPYIKEKIIYYLCVKPFIILKFKHHSLRLKNEDELFDTFQLT